MCRTQNFKISEPQNLVATKITGCFVILYTKGAQHFLDGRPFKNYTKNMIGHVGPAKLILLSKLNLM
jgi:hypothetical protein